MTKKQPPALPPTAVLTWQNYCLLRILEFRRGLQRILGGVHRRQPLVVLGVVANVDRGRRYRNVVLADAEEAADRQDQRIDLMVLDRKVGDFADRFILLILDIQALELG